MSLSILVLQRIAVTETYDSFQLTTTALAGKMFAYEKKFPVDYRFSETLTVFLLTSEKQIWPKITENIVFAKSTG